MAVYRISQIDYNPIHRIQSGYPELDRLFGKTLFDNGLITYGLPRGRISYIGGEPGVGKTRTAINICKAMNSMGLRILVFQGEVRPIEFKQWTGAVSNPNNFLVSDDRILEDMIRIIECENPDFVVIDSANMIIDFGKPSVNRNIFEGFKRVVAEIGCHCFMIGHLRKDGKTKGSTDNEYLTDITCKITKPEKRKTEKKRLADGRKAVVEYEVIPGTFVFTIAKNRYGESGGWAIFRHSAVGVEYIGSSLSPEVKEKVVVENVSVGSKIWQWFNK